jgi:anthranilate phosphoribosyltransferase
LGNDLGKVEAHELFAMILESRATTQEARQALVLLSKKIESAAEIATVVRMIRRKSKMPLRPTQTARLCDCCGTGGDGQSTFNISTVAAFVAAGAGAYVAKHGNRSITSRCGSSDLIEELGINLNASRAALSRSLTNAHFAYFHAPRFLHGFAQVQALRKHLAFHKIKTLFNLLGPLLNPMRVQRQIIGVPSRSVAKLLARVLQLLGHVRAMVYTSCGTDEMTTRRPTYMIEVKRASLRQIRLPARPFGLKQNSLRDLRGGSRVTNHRIALRLLRGIDHSSRRDVVLLTAGTTLMAAGTVRTIKQGILRAARALDSGEVYRNFLRAKHLLA